mgnify:CR=1 FL=1
MPDQIEMRLDGGEELLAAIRDADIALRAVLRAAVLEGAQVVADNANSQAPGPHIIAKVTESSSSGAEASIGPDADHWYYRFFETGAVVHEIEGNPLLWFEGRNGLVRAASAQHPGMPAQPFLRPAHDTTIDEQRDAVGNRLRAALPT